MTRAALALAAAVFVLGGCGGDEGSMDEARFWELIEETRDAADGDVDRHADLLTQRLADEDKDEIVAFRRHWQQKRVDAYRWDLWAAAYVINGGCSDDCFEYFRNYLIALGREQYQAALRDPDSLAGVTLREEPEAESIGYAALSAYESVTGSEMPPFEPREPSQPSGEEWDEDNVADVVPRLAAKYDW